MDRIFHKGKLVAIKIKRLTAGSKPVSEAREPLQVLTLKHKKGASVAPHTHRPRVRTTRSTQECLVVLKGKLQVSLYDANGEAFRHIVLSRGETLIVLSGGHGVKYLAHSEVIEVKNGPYIADKMTLGA